MESSASVTRSDLDSLIDGMAACFPVTRALVGDEGFRAMAHAFKELSQTDPSWLMTYSDTFCDVIGTCPSARTIPYLTDLARLEAAWNRARQAPDATPVTVEELAAFAPRAWERARAVLHTSVQVVRSAYPVVTIWEAQSAGPQCILWNAAPEDGLVARQDHGPAVHRLPPGGAVFIQHLMRNATFRESADEAAAADPGFDLVTSLSILLGHGLIIGFVSSTGE